MISPLAPAVRIINDALEPAVLGLLSDVRVKYRYL